MYQFVSRKMAPFFLHALFLSRDLAAFLEFSLELMTRVKLFLCRVLDWNFFQGICDRKLFTCVYVWLLVYIPVCVCMYGLGLAVSVRESPCLLVEALLPHLRLG